MLFVVIPAYNERDQIPTLLKRLENILQTSGYSAKIIVVDDGSTDGMSEAIAAVETSLDMDVVKHPINRGVSAAFRTGFDRLIQRITPLDCVLTLEANKSIDLSIISGMMHLLESGSDLVLASCYAPGGKVVGDPPLRLILSVGVNRLLRWLFPFKGIHTYTSFYRLWSGRLLLSIHAATQGNYFQMDGFACMADMLIKVIKMKNVTITEVPLILVSDIGHAGSKMKIFRTIRTYLTLIRSNLFA